MKLLPESEEARERRHQLEKASPELLAGLQRAATHGKRDIAAALEASVLAWEHASGSKLGVDGAGLADSLVADIHEGSALTKLIVTHHLPLIARFNSLFGLAGKSPEESHKKFYGEARGLMGKDPVSVAEKLEAFFQGLRGGVEVDQLISQVAAAKPILAARREGLVATGLHYKARERIIVTRGKTEQTSDRIITGIDDLITDLGAQQAKVLGLQADVERLQGAPNPVFQLGPTDPASIYRQHLAQLRELITAQKGLGKATSERNARPYQIREGFAAATGHAELFPTIGDMLDATTAQYYNARQATYFALATLATLTGPLVRVWSRAISERTQNNQFKAFAEFTTIARQARQFAEQQTSAYFESQRETKLIN